MSVILLFRKSPVGYSEAGRAVFVVGLRDVVTSPDVGCTDSAREFGRVIESLDGNIELGSDMLGELAVVANDGEGCLECEVRGPGDARMGGELLEATGECFWSSISVLPG